MDWIKIGLTALIIVLVALFFATLNMDTSYTEGRWECHEWRLDNWTNITKTELKVLEYDASKKDDISVDIEFGENEVYYEAVNYSEVNWSDNHSQIEKDKQVYNDTFGPCTEYVRVK